MSKVLDCEQVYQCFFQFEPLLVCLSFLLRQARHYGVGHEEEGSLGEALEAGGVADPSLRFVVTKAVHHGG